MMEGVNPKELYFKNICKYHNAYPYTRVYYYMLIK
jgi:hypothetical protein